MSGSAIADAAGLGQVLYKAMADNGFSKRFSAAIVAAAATIGPVIPPSIPFVVFAADRSVSQRSFPCGFYSGVYDGYCHDDCHISFGKDSQVTKAAQG